MHGAQDAEGMQTMSQPPLCSPPPRLLPQTSNPGGFNLVSGLTLSMAQTQIGKSSGAWPVVGGWGEGIQSFQAFQASERVGRFGRSAFLTEVATMKADHSGSHSSVPRHHRSSTTSVPHALLFTYQNAKSAANREVKNVNKDIHNRNLKLYS